MYTDATVIAGIVTVLLMIGFFAGVGVFIMKDIRNHRGKVVVRHKEGPDA